MVFRLLRLPYDVPPVVKALLLLPMASMVMTAVLCIVCLLAWRARQRSGAARTHGAIMALTGLAYIAWLGHWNLLGFRF